MSLEAAGRGGTAATVPIFCVGNFGKKQAAQRADGQWFYRSRERFGFGRWLPCEGRPDNAWYNPAAGRARLPQD